MKAQQNVDLKQHSTMRLGGTADYLVEVSSRQELQQAIDWAEKYSLPMIMIGGGSNIIWRDEGFRGLVIINKILGFEKAGQFDYGTYITVGAGENWDQTVARTTEMGLSGIEFLSLIPGSVGATPVQNVGAYGAEVKDVITVIEAYDLQEKKFVTIRGSECEFSYRSSRFKTTDKGRYFITYITMILKPQNPSPPFYNALQKYLHENNITDTAPQTIRNAVIAIRQEKLPDPAVVANNGSFFANPLVEDEIFMQLAADNPDMPHWNADGGLTKLSAAWLVEQAGYKDFHDATTGMATWAKQPLVLVNEKATSTTQLIQFRDTIINAVKQKFGVTLEQEPEII